MRRNLIREHAELIAERFKDENKSDIPDFSLISPALHGLARERWMEGDAIGLMVLLDDDRRLIFVEQNTVPLKAKGMYEEALLNAWTSVKYTWLKFYHFFELKEFFQMADKQKLLDAGDPVPDQDEFTLYRGISGTGIVRNPWGISWTSSPNVAAWYALRFDDLNFDDPAVYRVKVKKEQILAYSNDAQDETYLFIPGSQDKLERLDTMPDVWIPPSYEASTSS